MGANQDPGRERLDVMLVERGLAPTRTKARALIIAGQVLSAGERLDKPGLRISRTLPLEVQAGRRYVSRGATKLRAALIHFGVDPRGRDALDVGASTGGFTQVLLSAGVTRVVALDVGHGQLDWSLRRDPRVSPIERVNARHLEPARLPFLPSLAVVDVSFISLELVLPPVVACLQEAGEIVALVKPQFEVGRGQVGRGGIVRDVGQHRRVLEAIARRSGQCGWGLRGFCAAAIRGAEGNQEYFVHLCPSRPELDAESRTEELTRITRAISEEPL